MENQIVNEEAVRFFNGELSFEEMKNLNGWIEDSNQNYQSFREVRYIWLLTSTQSPDHLFNTRKAWKKTKKVLFVGVKSQFQQFFDRCAMNCIEILRVLKKRLFRFG